MNDYRHLSVEKDWRAMREYLIDTLHDAKRFAASAPMLPGGFEGQVEVLSSALDFMDQRERAYLVPAAAAGPGTDRVTVGDLVTPLVDPDDHRQPPPDRPSSVKGARLAGPGTDGKATHLVGEEDEQPHCWTDDTGLWGTETWITHNPAKVTCPACMPEATARMAGRGTDGGDQA